MNITRKLRCLITRGCVMTAPLLCAGAMPSRAATVGPPLLAVRSVFTVVQTKDFVESPAISGRTVVWAETRGRLQLPSVYQSLYGASLTSRHVFRIHAPTQIVSPPYGAPSPGIDGDIVVWMGCQVCSGHGLAIFPRATTVYAADLRTWRVVPLSRRAGSQVFPVVSGQVVVWSTEDNRGRLRAYGKDLATGREFPIFYRSDQQTSMSISGGIAVWAEAGAPAAHGWTIVGQNIRTGRTFVVTTSTQLPRACNGDIGFFSTPLISGQTVVWARECSDQSLAIEAKNLVTGHTFQVVRLPAGQFNYQIGPHIAFDGRIVVWDQARHGRFTSYGDVDIYAKDILTGRTLRVTRDPGPHSWPAISRHVVVWSSDHAIRGAVLTI
jgi:hypothetical protein